MIRVRRPPTPPPSLKGPNAAAERNRAVEHFAKKRPPGSRRKPFAFKAYSAADVKLALETMFQRKCAYCETRYAATQPVDVEHWRPKSEVKESDGKSVQGYYWLASEWENLLPSCIDCNRERKQIVDPNQPARAVGKANRFPVKGARALRPDDVATEVPLLLNPCDLDTNPADHLEFTRDGIVRARVGSAGPSERGEASVEVYALNRSGLVLERLERVRLIELGMQRIALLAKLLEGNPSPSGGRLDLIEDLIAHEMNTLHIFTQDGEPYAQMARQLLSAFLRD